MTVHPLSIRRQIELQFPTVAQARFEFAGWDTVYRVRLQDGTSGHSQANLAEFLQKNRSVGTRVRLETWTEGPTWPPMFDGFSKDQLDLLEASDPTKDGVEAALLQACSYLSSANCETVDAGVVRVTVASDTALDSGRLDECRKFVEATLGVPGVKVSVVSGIVEPNPDSGANLPVLIHQGSRDGIVDPVLLKLARLDEDVYREARVAGFPSVAQSRSGLSVFLPIDGSWLNLRHILPLYDFAYFPVEAFHNRGSSYGVTWQDALLLAKNRRLVPVLTKRFGEYDQKQLRELLELGGDVVSPRQLTVATAASLLDMNPLWRIANEDRNLAATLLSDIRAGLTGFNAPASVAKFIGEWIDFQTDGVTNFAAGALRQGGLLPLHFGPGALAAKLLRSMHGTKVPDLEAAFTGMHVSHSMAMFAGCVPAAHAGLYPLYELTTLMLGARYAETNDSPIKAIPFIADLDKLLESIELAVPANISVHDWIEKTGPAMSELREALADLFSGSNFSIESVKSKTADVEWKIANLVENRGALKRSVDKFEIVGLAADAIALLADSGFPFAGTVIAAIMKRTLPKLWQTLGENQHTRTARDVLEGMGHEFLLVSSAFIGS